MQSMCCQAMNDLFVRESCLHLPSFCWADATSKWRSFWGLRSDPQADMAENAILERGTLMKSHKSCLDMTAYSLGVAPFPFRQFRVAVLRSPTAITVKLARCLKVARNWACGRGSDYIFVGRPIGLGPTIFGTSRRIHRHFSPSKSP